MHWEAGAHSANVKCRPVWRLEHRCDSSHPTKRIVGFGGERCCVRWAVKEVLEQGKVEVPRFRLEFWLGALAAASHFYYLSICVMRLYSGDCCNQA